MADLNGPLDGDSAINRKHQAMIERLSNQHQARVEGHRNKEDSTSSSSESTATFVSRFSELKSSISTQISLMKESPDKFSKSDIDTLTASIADLDKFLALNTYYLPPYDVRASLKSISDLKVSLDEVSTLMFPRKKFSFKNRPTKQKPVSPDEKIEPEKPQPEPCVRTTLVRDSPGLRDREREVLTKNFMGKEVGEFTLSNLNSCEVRLMGSARTIFVNKLRDCKVYCGPVLGSILIDEADGCVFVLASHQIRIHNAKNCDFYLRVRSRPIIEDCSGVRFAPYCLQYEGIEGDLKGSNLDEETGNWGNVDDFKWLRAVQSPNWSILPEDERTGAFTVCD